MLPRFNPFWRAFVLAIVISSCSNKFLVRQQPTDIEQNKLAFNSSTYCTLRESDDVYGRDWYKGASTINSPSGELKIEFDFFVGGIYENNYTGPAIYNFVVKPTGYRDQGAHSFQSRIGLDKHNRLLIRYDQQSIGPLTNLFTLEASIVGGTGLFKNASGNITTRVQINRISKSALVNHSGTLYLGN